MLFLGKNGFAYIQRGNLLGFIYFSNNYIAAYKEWQQQIFSIQILIQTEACMIPQAHVLSAIF
jgi:hypothetical protein